MQYMIVCLSQGHSLNFELLGNLKLGFKLKLCEPEFENKTEIMISHQGQMAAEMGEVRQ